ncbi:MAG: hypothetical protein M0015_05910 [Betaproteobacteria bacterium]|nr:hypothetical protein [Betaproteobacteria bacterium]
MSTARVLSLVPKPACKTTIAELRYWLRSAERGELAGVALIAFRGAGLYSTGLAGVARANPTFTRGALRALDGELDELVRASHGVLEG